MSELGNKIRDRRLRLELTQTEVAQRVGVNQSTVARLESGEHRDARGAILRRIGVVLGLPVQELLKQ